MGWNVLHRLDNLGKNLTRKFSSGTVAGSDPVNLNVLEMHQPVAKVVMPFS